MSVSTLDHKVKTYSVRHACWMAQTAALAYQDESTIQNQTEQWGFDRLRHHKTAFQPPFPLMDSQAFTIASDHMIVTAFRGTQPIEIRDWLSDVNTPPWPGPGNKGLMHYGFGAALKSIYPDVLNAVNEFRDQDQTVWFTGHSLGGALAALAGMKLHFESPRILPDGVYTFGQPRVADRILAMAHDKALAKRTHRFVNNNDIVPQLPPEPVYHHVSTLHHIDASGRLRESMPLLSGLADHARGLTADAFAPASDGIRDHMIDRYIAALEKNIT